MLAIQVALGGITRLTGSGLSITEWKPILGAVPPLNDADWNAAFDQYKGIAQYRFQNAGYTLSDFKLIYFWEWMHREWARLIGVVFLIGFVYFGARGYFKRWMVSPFIALFLLGALQGAVGWIMVQSGLNDTDIRVSHIRLAAHFMAALLLVCYTLWFALKTRMSEGSRIRHRGMQRFTIGVIGLLTVQLVWGAFMAGLRAAMAAPTWPSINGEWWPSNTTFFGRTVYAGFRAASDHPLLVHAIHRTLGYTVAVLIVGWSIAALRTARANRAPVLRRWAPWPSLLVTLQIALGIASVLLSPQARLNAFGPFEVVAQAHQLVAMALLMTLVGGLFAVSGRRQMRAQSAPVSATAVLVAAPFAA